MFGNSGGVFVLVCLIRGSLAHADGGQCSCEKTHIAYGTLVNTKGGHCYFIFDPLSQSSVNISWKTIFSLAWSKFNTK